MSSQEDEKGLGDDSDRAIQGVYNAGSKKRKLQRACDICRRRKVRCDGGSMPQNRCSNCRTGKLNCTYVESRMKRPPKRSAETLDTRLDKMERLISTAMAEGDYGIDPVAKNGKKQPPPVLSPGTPSFPFLSQEDAPDVNDADLSSSDDEAGVVQLSYDMQKLTMDTTLQRFFGKSSGAVLIMAARDVKNKHVQSPEASASPKVFGTRRPQYWAAQPWVRDKLLGSKSSYEFPEENLMWSLIDLYFTHVNKGMPLLHRPTFEGQVADGFHLRDGAFGGTLCLMCAVGARFSADPRVILEGTGSPSSAGWQWYDQVQLVRNSCLAPPSIYEIQSYCLAGTFLWGCSSPQACWNIVGIGLRLIQDIGAHRKKVYSENPSVSDELWKRAFWCMIAMDRVTSIAIGRSPALHDEDFDVDLPLEVDDQYWVNSDPSKAFKQPAGKPSLVSFFVSFIKLHQIAAFALRTIYTINRSKVLLGYVGPQWRQSAVAELDSALNKWVDNVPPHLRWNPDQEDQTFFDQSAILWSYYYQTQILVHRPFIPKPHRPSQLPFPSLTICMNAARSCSHLVDIQRERNSSLFSMAALPVFTSGIVLLMGIWGASKPANPLDYQSGMEDVDKCMRALLACESKCHFAGRFWDILRDLAEVGNISYSGLPSNGRAQGPDVSKDSLSNGSSPSVADSHSTEATASGNAHSFPPPFSSPFGHALSMHTSDLSKLPPHDGTKYQPPSNVDGRKSEFWSPSPPSGSQIHSDSLQMLRQTPGPLTLSDYPYPWMGPDMQSQFGSSSYPDSDYRTLEQQIHSMAHPQFMPQGTNTSTQSTSTNNTAGLLDLYSLPLQSPHKQSPQSYSQRIEEYSSSDPLQTLRMWSNAPSGFELDDWNEYIQNVNGRRFASTGNLGFTGIGST